MSVLMKFIDPKTDLAFKAIFGTEKHQHILVDFLNDILAYWQDPPITSVTFIKTTQDGEIVDQGATIVDVMCQDTHGRRFIVEIQVRHHEGFLERVQLYTSRAYVLQNSRKINYRDIEPVTTIVITDFDVFPDKPGYKSHHAILDIETHKQDLTSQRYVFLNLAKFTNQRHESVTAIEKWCYFLKHTDEIPRTDWEDFVAGFPSLRDAYELLAMYAWDTEKYLIYESQVDRIKVYDLTIATARKEGHAEGELQTKITIARELMRQGVPLTAIMSATELSEEMLLQSL